MTEHDIRQQIYDDIMAVAQVYAGLVMPWAEGMKMAAQIAVRGKADDNFGPNISLVTRD